LIADVRATIAELAGEIRQKGMELRPGASGPPGPPGPPGSPGKLPLAKSWEPGRVFYSGDVVVHGGATYQCLRDTGRSVTHADDWICLARAGRDGLDGITPDIRGTYVVNEEYKRLDIVAMDGAAFIARYDDPGLCPGEGWQLMSRQGKPGRRGEDGAVGPRGERGEEGLPAVVPKFVRSEIDENYNLIILRSDDSREIIPLRPAFERFVAEVVG
jgi:hypothetical protein